MSGLSVVATVMSRNLSYLPGTTNVHFIQLLFSFSAEDAASLHQFPQQPLPKTHSETCKNSNRGYNITSLHVIPALVTWWRSGSSCRAAVGLHSALTPLWVLAFELCVSMMLSVQMLQRVISAALDRCFCPGYGLIFTIMLFLFGAVQIKV